MTLYLFVQRLKPIYDYLEEMSVLIDEIPPIQQPMRFGNKAYRTWLDKVTENSAEKIAKFSSVPGFEKSIPEIKVYWDEAFGHYERLDYGTGHELTFLAFLFCLFKMGILEEADLCATINKVF